MSTHPQHTRDLKFILLFIPAAYATYCFHEFGHWVVGEILGNDMVYSLNYVWPRSGSYVDASHGLYVSMGGPAFTVLQAMLSLAIIEQRRILTVYPFVFFPMFNRYFSLLLGGFSRQDEARISLTLGLGTYTVAIIVLLILTLLVVRSSSRLKIGFRNNNYLLALSTFCQLLVIGTYKFISL
jgi:hypothetical protein